MLDDIPVPDDPQLSPSKSDPKEAARLGDLAQLFEWAPNALLLVDGDGCIVHVNEQVEQLLGRQRGDLLGMNVANLVPDRLRGEYGPHLDLLLRGPDPSPGASQDALEVYCRGEDGGEIPLELRFKVVQTRSGRQVLASVVDISRRKEAERQRNRLVEELSAANAELEGFSYSVSHDLRAPLRAIKGFSGLLLEEKAEQLDDEGKRLLTIVQANVVKMSALIDDLLSFARSARHELRLSRVSMTPLARQALEEARDHDGKRDVEIIVGELPDAMADPQLMAQVWRNLCDNAVKYTRGESSARIVLRGWREDGYLYYSVTDNGVGFDMRYVDKLFGVFQRLHGSAEFEGTGVGLALVRRIIARHGGEISATAELGKGATFQFRLPVEITS